LGPPNQCNRLQLTVGMYIKPYKIGCSEPALTPPPSFFLSLPSLPSLTFYLVHKFVKIMAVTLQDCCIICISVAWLLQFRTSKLSTFQLLLIQHKLSSPCLSEKTYSSSSRRCWQYEPEDRPHFGEIHATVDLLYSRCLLGPETRV